MIGLTAFVAHPFGAGFVVLPPPLLEDLAEALDDERHFLVVELGGVDGDSTWSRLLLFFHCLKCNGLHLGCRGGALLLSSLEASMGILLGVDSSFSSIALNATGCTSGVEVAPCSKLTMCLESLIISSKLTNLPITSSGDICLYLGSPQISCT